MPFKRIAVYCGSSSGSSEDYTAAAVALGQELARRKIGLVYGGGNVGLMGIVAQTVMDGLGPGSVIGIIPEAMVPREISGTTVGEVQVVPDMHTRKAAMYQLADAFVALPGGYGTLDELVEMITWRQLGYHAKPVGCLSTKGYYAPLLTFFDHATTEGFIGPKYRDILQSSGDPGELLDMLESYQGPAPVLGESANPELASLAKEIQRSE